MKVSNEFILREIAGEYMLVPVGGAAVRCNGLISLNEIGGFLFTALAREQTEDELVEKLVSTYRVDPETARTDLREFLEQLQQIGALEPEAL